MAQERKFAARVGSSQMTANELLTVCMYIRTTITNAYVYICKASVEQRFREDKAGSDISSTYRNVPYYAMFNQHECTCGRVV